MMTPSSSSAEQARSAFEYHVAQLGIPRRRALDGDIPSRQSTHVSFEDAHNLHPIFALTHAFTGEHDGGYTSNPYRGAHQSVPCWSEGATFGILETSFHKGDLFIEFVDFPEAAAERSSEIATSPNDTKGGHYEAARLILDPTHQ